MENREVANSSKMSSELIAGFFLFGILTTIVYCIIINIFKNILANSLPILTAIVIFLQAITYYFTWKFSISYTMKKKTMETSNLSRVMRNIIIFTVIFLIISSISIYFDYKKVSSSTQSISSGSSLVVTSRTSDLANSSLNKLSQQSSICFTLKAIGCIAYAFGMLPAIKKEILKHI